MTARELSVLRDKVTRARRVGPPVVLSPREAAGRSALAAMREAERREAARRPPASAVRRSSKSKPLHGGRPLLLRNVPEVPVQRWVEPPRPPARDHKATNRALKRLARENAAAARLVSALPDLDLIADNIDPFQHVRGILSMVADRDRRMA